MKVQHTTLTRCIRAFERYNAAKRKFMYDCDPVGARVVLELLPLLLHVNHPSLPGYVGDDCPCGVNRMAWSMDDLRETGAFFSSRFKLADLRGVLPKKRMIEGIYTIGSVGSLAQTRDSDYDIWIVVDSDKIGAHGMVKLRSKLRRIQRYLVARFVIDIHFFLMDVKDIRSNDFGSISQEGSGTAMKSLLKEEFYRTMTLVEGCIPVWWVVPAGSDEGGYDEVRGMLLADPRDADADFIDMGDVEATGEHELIGAALWQMHKALDDPLKSVLKMALIVSSMNDAVKVQPLCNILRKDVQDPPRDVVVDPYLYVLRRVENHYGALGDTKSVELLRKCFYLKVCPGIRPADLVRMERNDKASIMVDVVKSWGWSLHAVTALNAFENWDVERYRSFGDDIHSFLKMTTVKLIRMARNISHETSIDEDIEVEVLRRRIEAFYVAKKGKIEAEKRVKKREPAYRDLYFAYKKGRWSIFEHMPSGDAQSVMSADRVVEILAWLVYNRRFDASTAFHMVPNPTGVVLPDIQDLLWKLIRIIPEAASIGLDRSSLMEDKYASIIVVIGNMECPESRHIIREIDILYMNTWKELFCVYLAPEQLKGWMARMRRQRTEVHIWLPREAYISGLTGNLASMVSA